MKKTIYSLIIASFVFGLIATAVRAEDTDSEVEATTVITATEAVTTSYPATATTTTVPADLEKIPSPEYIKYFQMIKKIGNSLFGVRKATSTERIELKKPEDSNKLEKIEHPGLVNMYEKIQRIGTALWGIKKRATSTPFIIAPEISACVVSAIDVKDKALMARVTVAATELNVALSARSACQQAAVIATSSPRETLNACVKTFGEAHKVIREASKKLQSDTWKAYQESLKACRTSATSTAPVPMIEDGGNLFD